MKEMLRRLFIASIAALLLAGPASAGQIVVKLGLVPGTLQVSAAHVSSSSVTLTVADGRGNGNGWTLRASRSVVVTGITARCADGSTCTLPQSASTPAGSVVLSAAKGTGMGVMSVTVQLAAAPHTPLAFTVS
jgi:hypothetical protein